MHASNMEVRTFPEWEGKPIDELLYQCRELVEDPTFPTVRRWRDAGGRVLGHFQVYFPEEIAHAAGMLPLKLRGAPIEPTQADSHFGSYLCSIVKTSLETVLAQHARVDLFVTHPICDAARNLAGVWGRNFDFPCQILYLPQNANSAHAGNVPARRVPAAARARSRAWPAGRSPTGRCVDPSGSTTRIAR